MDPIELFQVEKEKNIAKLGQDESLTNIGLEFINETAPYNYSYNFSWMGRPIIQFPQDMVAMQELIWEVKPDLIIETGIAHGGSLVYYASLLELIGNGRVLGIDIDIREHNRKAIEQHPMFKRIDMIQGSSIDPGVVKEVEKAVQGQETVLVTLDSNHTHEHVLKELQVYAPFVTKGSYCVVFDTIIEDMPKDSFPDRLWKKGDNPKTAVHEYLNSTDRFVIDESIHNKLLITVAPDGYLKCVED